MYVNINMSNMAALRDIPVVDVKGLTENEEDLQKLAAQIKDAFTNIGFVALTNHNVSEEFVKEAWDKVKEFKALPTDVKMKYREDTKNKKFGWSPIGAQVLYNPGTEIPPYDLREAVNMIPAKFDWPSETPGMKESTMAVTRHLFQLGQFVLKLMAMALNFEDKDFFCRTHALFTEDDSSSITFATYPPIPQGGLLKGQMRCGEHTDWGSITLLIQDENGGLEIQRPDGSWIETHPPPNTVLVNIGDLMQRWTSDAFVSTNHRVREPKDENLKQITRRSMIYFMFPGDDTMISSLDGSNKYPPIGTAQYLWEKCELHMH